MKDQFIAQMFSNPGYQIYTIIDGASAKGLLNALSLNNAEYYCLFSGKLHPELAETAPYLVKLEQRSPLTDWLIGNWGKHFGIFAFAPTDCEFTALHKHFRSLITVAGPYDEPFCFRYYDPRVLRKLLPTFNAGEIQEFFGPVNTYVLEGKQQDSVMQYWAGSNGVEYKQYVYAAG